MIVGLAKLLGVDKWLVGAVAALAVAGLMFWAASSAYNRIYDSGYQAAAGKFTAEIAELKSAAADALSKEIERQASVQNSAKAREAERIAEMQAANEDLNQKIEELQREASQDPDAGRVVLGAPSVQRINKIR